MCELKSWIEKNGEVYHLTDIDLQDPVIRNRLEGCKDNDFIGHGAIRKAFNITGGEQKELRTFWNPDLFPPKIADTLRQFEKHYSWQWENCLTNADLRYIIEYAPDEWRGKAFTQLIKQKPTNADLRYIVASAPDEWRGKAFTQLIKQKPNNSDLCYIVRYAPDKWRGKAFTQLIKQKPNNSDLCYIVRYAPDKWRGKASAQLIKQKPTNDDLLGGGEK